MRPSEQALNRHCGMIAAGGGLSHLLERLGSTEGELLHGCDDDAMEQALQVDLCRLRQVTCLLPSLRPTDSSVA